MLYSHFESRDAIIAAVALKGFKELAEALHRAARGASDGRRAVQKVGKAYLAFASEHRALYQAMFTLPIGLRFAEADTMIELKDAFAALAAVVTPRQSDRDLATETLWASLHGLAELESSGRIRRNVRDERLELVVAVLCQS